jgi:polysaccharide biosynthesis transport protein
MRQSSADQGMVSSPVDRGEIDIVALFKEIGRRKWLVLICTAVSLVLSVVAVNVLKPRFTAETSVFLESRDTEYTRIGREGGRMQEPVIDQDAVLSQVQLVMSRDIARTMIRKFDLGSKREFDSLMDGIGPVTKTLIMFGVLDNPANVSPEERVMDKYFDKLKVFGKAKSRVLSIEFQSRDPELAAKMSTAVAEEYIRQLEQAKKGTAQSAGNWLARTIEQLRQRVSVAESKVEAYRNANGLFLVGTENNNISSQQLSELNTQLATARAQQADLSSRARLIRDAIRQGRIFEVSEVVNNEVVRRLLETRATLRAQIAQEERTLLPQHPRIKELYAQLTGLEEQVRAAADRAARALDNDSRAAGARVVASQSELDQQKKLNGSANENEVQLRALEREAKAEREQLENYLARYRDASVRDTDNAVAADARIVSRAMVPSSPTFPKKLPIIFISTMAGLVLSLFWVLMRALLSDRVYVRRTPVIAQSYPMMPMMTPQMMAQMYPGFANPAMVHPAMMPTTAPQMPASSVSMPQQQAVESAAAPGVAEPPDDKAAAMRAALGRFGEALKARLPDSTPAPVVMPVGRMVSELPPRTAAMAAQATTDTTHIATQLAVPTVALAQVPASPIPNLVAPSFVASTSADGETDNTDLYDPLVEVADEAQAALVRGRPVSILVVGVEGGAFAAGTMQKLESILSRRGPTAKLSVDPHQIQAPDLSVAIRGLGGSYDYVLALGGAISSQTAALSRTLTLTVLVASDDLEDPQTDRAKAMLPGCNYFIVSASAPAAGAAVSFTNAP